ncbi:MAG: hypothetical protein HOV80_25705 [Polyangiaceae bacterium]|nr:hypothetical protein [Polyangiaceae bacterium]
MSRLKFITPTVATWMVVAALVAAALSVYFGTRAELRRAYGELLVCLAGPIDVAPEDAERAVRRRIWRPGPEEMASCADTADRVTNVWLAKWHARAVVNAAGTAASALRDGRRPGNAEELWSAGASLGYHVEPDPNDPRAPIPLVDRDLEELRARVPGALFLVDRAPRGGDDELRATLYGNEDLVLRTEGGKSFRRVSREPHQTIDFGRYGFYPQVDLSKWIAFKGADALWVVQKDDRGAVRGPPQWLGDDNATALEGCHTSSGELLLVKDVLGATVYRLGEDIEVVHEIVPAGGEEGSNRTGYNLACDGDLFRVTWAASDPVTPPTYGLGMKLEIPTDTQRHRVDVVTCTPSDCSHERIEVRGLDVMWFSSGGYGSSWGLGAPDAYAVGDRILLVWEGMGFLRYRFAPLEELSNVPTGSVVEVLRTQDNSSTVDPRAISYNRWRAFVRGDALVLAVTDESHTPYKGTTFFVRFDEGGAVELLRPPAR